MPENHQKINVGLLGLGVIGSRLAKFLLEDCPHSEQPSLQNLSLTSILVNNINKKRGFNPPAKTLTDDADSILEDPTISIVVELIGGESPAVEFITKAINSGKHVVTANKEVMAKHGWRLINLANKKGVALRFEASVGGGIPTIRPLINDLSANYITSIRAIINGTTNFILTKMAVEQLDFLTALAQAQSLGFAETDPTNDIEGIDAAYKLAILASLGFHGTLDPSEIYREGIGDLNAKDFRYAHELGREIKLLAIARRQDDGTIEARVHPVLLPIGSPLSKVEGASNAIEVSGDLIGSVMFSGPGAGATPTISAVLADIINVIQGMERIQPTTDLENFNANLKFHDQLRKSINIKPMVELITRYYMRLNVQDRGGVLAQIATVMGDLNISIASVIQKDSDPESGTAELVITSHPSVESSVQEAVRRLKTLESIKSFDSMIRLEEG